jgi:site-specific DNA recombinase
MRAAIYTRVSTRKQDEEGTSLQTQLAHCREFAAARGWSLDQDLVFQEVHTGAELWDRPVLTKLRQLVREHAIDVIVCYAIDRLSRDPVHLGVIVSEAEHARVAVEFVSEPLDDTPEGQLVRFVRGYAARVEREKARERTLRGKRARVENGKLHNHGSELYGYQRDKEVGRRVVVDSEANTIRALFKMVAQGSSINAAIKHLNDGGIPAPSTGKLEFRDGRTARWGNGMVYRILRNPAYVGETIEWRHKRTDSSGRFEIRPESDCPKARRHRLSVATTGGPYRIASQRTRRRRRPGTNTGRISYGA